MGVRERKREKEREREDVNNNRDNYIKKQGNQNKGKS